MPGPHSRSGGCSLALTKRLFENYCIPVSSGFGVDVWRYHKKDLLRARAEQS